MCGAHTPTEFHPAGQQPTFVSSKSHSSGNGMFTVCLFSADHDRSTVKRPLGRRLIVVMRRGLSGNPGRHHGCEAIERSQREVGALPAGAETSTIVPNAAQPYNHAIRVIPGTCTQVCADVCGSEATYFGRKYGREVGKQHLSVWRDSAPSIHAQRQALCIC